MEIFDRTVNNVVYLFSGWFITTLTAFIFWLIAGKFLTQEEYGIAITTINLGVFIINIITLGLPLAISKFIPELIKKNEIKKIKTLISTTFFIIILTNLLSIGIIYLNLDYFSTLIKIPKQAIITMLIYVFLGSLNTIALIIVYSYQNMKKYLTANMLFSASKVLVVLALLLYGYKYFGPIFGVIIGSIISFLICFSPNFITFKGLFKEKQLFVYAFSGIIGTIVFSMLSNFQYVIVSIIKTTTTTGIFGIAMMISSIVSVFPSILNTSIYPIMSGLSVDKKQTKSASRLIENTLRYSLFLTTPIILTFYLLPELLVLSFSSNKFLEASKLLPILAPASFMFGLSSVLSNSIYAMKKPEYYRNILITIATIFLIITPILTYYFSDLGMSIGYLITTSLFFFLSLFFLNKIIKIKFPLKDMLKIFIASISFSILYFVKPFTINIILGGIFVSLSFLIYLIILVLLKFFNNDDARILEFFALKIRFAKPIINFILKIIKNN